MGTSQLSIFVASKSAIVTSRRVFPFQRKTRWLRSSLLHAAVLYFQSNRWLRLSEKLSAFSHRLSAGEVRFMLIADSRVLIAGIHQSEFDSERWLRSSLLRVAVLYFQANRWLRFSRSSQLSPSASQLAVPATAFCSSAWCVLTPAVASFPPSPGRDP